MCLRTNIKEPELKHNSITCYKIIERKVGFFNFIYRTPYRHVRVKRSIINGKKPFVDTVEQDVTCQVYHNIFTKKRSEVYNVFGGYIHCYLDFELAKSEAIALYNNYENSEKDKDYVVYQVEIPKDVPMYVGNNCDVAAREIKFIYKAFDTKKL